jgi:arsenite methyltransferase
MENNNTIQDFVKEYYGKVLQSSKDLKTNACCTAEAPPLHLKRALKHVPAEVIERYYGCGSPLPSEINGLTVVDLGSGSGRDCYVAASLVGESGNVIGIDMTEEQLTVAREHVDSYCKELGYKKSNLEFKQGYIEFLEETGIAPASVDLVISNCVVNLSPDKALVIDGVSKILKEGGEFYFSDVYCDRRLPEEVQKHELLYGECLAGALYTEDFIRLSHQAGFADPRILSQAPIEITDRELNELVGEAKFYSITYRLFKLGGLESLCEDYGQVAIYQGGIPDQDSAFALDDHHYFIKNKPHLVCGNTASMLEETRLKPYFKIQGDRKTHYGLFDCSTPESATGNPDSAGACC